MSNIPNRLFSKLLMKYPKLWGVNKDVEYLDIDLDIYNQGPSTSAAAAKLLKQQRQHQLESEEEHQEQARQETVPDVEALRALVNELDHLGKVVTLAFDELFTNNETTYLPAEDRLYAHLGDSHYRKMRFGTRYDIHLTSKLVEQRKESSKFWVQRGAVPSVVKATNFRSKRSESPLAKAICEPKEIQPDIHAPARAPTNAPVLLLHGTNMPKVNRPQVVPAAIAVTDVATLNMPLNCSKTNTKATAITPNIKIHPLTRRVELRSVNFRRKEPFTISSSITKAVEFNTTDSELRAAPNTPAIKSPGTPPPTVIKPALMGSHLPTWFVKEEKPKQDQSVKCEFLQSDLRRICLSWSTNVSAELLLPTYVMHMVGHTIHWNYEKIQLEILIGHLLID
uniref:Uncharacterized protein n=1 Tax=Glossina pallidipes TaxID=7398 RepID=A0A1B0A5X6_GLOPL